MTEGLREKERSTIALTKPNDDDNGDDEKIVEERERRKEMEEFGCRKL